MPSNSYHGRRGALVLPLPCFLPGGVLVLPKEDHPEGLKGHSRGFCKDQAVLCFPSGIPDNSIRRKVRKGALKTAKQVCLQGSAGAVIHDLIFERNILDSCHLQNLSPLFFQKYHQYEITTTHNTKSCLSLKCLCSCYLCNRIGLRKSCHSRTGHKNVVRHSQIPIEYVEKWHLEASEMPDFKVKATEQLHTTYSASKETTLCQPISHRYRHDQHTS